MRRGVGWALIAAAFAVGLYAAHGCVDDRAKVAASIFFCNPSSRTADADCGKGFMCYSGAQALGGSICVPVCDPADPATCPDGACTAAGACLQRCKVPDPGQPEPCPSPLLCRRTTINPIEAAAGPDGVCLPVNSACSSNVDCTSPVFTECSSNTTGATQGPGLLTSGEVCLQGHCSDRGIACEPGSACVPEVLPHTIPGPDVCSPICTPARDRPDGGTFNECLPGLTCLSDAFPQTDAPACAPGFPGWLCVDDLGCTAGTCYEWSDIAPDFAGFRTCAPACNSDDDCVPFDRGGNPTFLTRNTCHDGKCRNLQSLFFPITCLRDGDPCRLDPEARCTAPAAPDMGMVPSMGLGAFGGQAAICVHGCTERKDCDTLAARLHVPMTCGSIGPRMACVPVIPSLIECKPMEGCFGDLTCETVNGLGRQACTRRCATSADCAADPALGTTFYCSSANVCLPKVESGQPAASADQCISGQIAKGVCVSPTGWACSADDQCANGQCALLPRTIPPFGRCN